MAALIQTTQGQRRAQFVYLQLMKCYMVWFNNPYVPPHQTLPDPHYQPSELRPPAPGLANIWWEAPRHSRHCCGEEREKGWWVVLIHIIHTSTDEDWLWSCYFKEPALFVHARGHGSEGSEIVQLYQCLSFELCTHGNESTEAFYDRLVLKGRLCFCKQKTGWSRGFHGLTTERHRIITKHQVD